MTTTEATIRGIAEEIDDFYNGAAHHVVNVKDRVCAIISRGLSASVPERSVDENNRPTRIWVYGIDDEYTGTYYREPVNDAFEFIRADVIFPPTIARCYAKGDEGAEFCAESRELHCTVLGDSTFWTSAEGQHHLAECMRDKHLIHHRFIPSAPEQSPRVCVKCGEAEGPISGMCRIHLYGDSVRGCQCLNRLEDNDSGCKCEFPASVPETKWKCACGWKGVPSEMTVSNTLRTCPKCGASGGLILDSSVPDGGVEAMRKVLKDCRSALMSLEPESLGRHPEGGWFYRDELVSYIDKSLTATQEEK